MKISSSSSFHHHREDHDGPDDPSTQARFVSRWDDPRWKVLLESFDSKIWTWGFGDQRLWWFCGKKPLDWLIFVEGIGGSYYVSTMELMVMFCIFSLKPFCWERVTDKMAGGGETGAWTATTTSCFCVHLPGMAMTHSHFAATLFTSSEFRFLGNFKLCW